MLFRSVYTVSQVFRETGTVTAVGQRIFSVKINNQSVQELTDFDLFAVAGLNPKQIDTPAVSNGYIDLSYSYKRGTLKTAIVSWIEIKPYVVSPVPPATLQIGDGNYACAWQEGPGAYYLCTAEIDSKQYRAYFVGP